MSDVLQRICTVDETQQSYDQAVDAIFRDWTAREIALGIFDTTIQIAWFGSGWRDPLHDLAQTMATIDEDESQFHIIDFEGAISVTPEQLAHFVELWQAALVDMSAGHSHEAFTRGEHSTDDLLNPILTLPIEQMREFATALSERLEHDERVPYLVWSTFKRIVTPLILKRPAGEVLQLKTALATEVAELVESRLPRQDLVAAMAAALAWRGVEQLTEIKEAVEQQGAQPRLRGRQSCLFLVAENADGKELATVIV